MHGDALLSFLIILLTAIVVQFFSGKLKIPSVIGFLLTGILLGPNGFLETKNNDLISNVSEVGIILMLFTIGIEFSLDDLLKRKKVALLGGVFQVTITGAVMWGIMLILDLPPRQALFYAMLATLSSTAVVIKLFNDKKIMESIVGKSSLSLLIFQDISAVLFIVFLPLFSVSGASADISVFSLTLSILTGIAILIGIFILARYLVPQILYQVLKLRNRELFLLMILLIIVGITVVSSELGLSVGLGAFLAGLVISDSDYSNYTLSHIVPFQDLFTSLFFISVGFLFDPMFTFENIGLIAMILAVVLGVKILVLYPVCIFVGLSSAAALTVAFSLSQIGEFSFILASLGNNAGLIEGVDYRIFVAVTLISMAATPFLILAVEQITGQSWFKKVSERIDALSAGAKQENRTQTMNNHLIIIGFGLTGKLHAQICRKLALPYIVVEMNPQTVKHEKKRGTNIIHGDASSPFILEHIGVEHARAAVVSVPNQEGTVKIIQALKAANPKLYVIARCRHVFEVEELMACDADRVVAVELESGLEMLSLTMSRYFVTSGDIEQNLQEIRMGLPTAHRGSIEKSLTLSGSSGFFDEVETIIYKVSEGSPLVGISLHDTAMRTDHQVSLLAYKRGEAIYPNPASDYRFAPNDVLMLFGRPGALANYADKFSLS